jgi:TonB family protein
MAYPKRFVLQCLLVGAASACVREPVESRLPDNWIAPPLTEREEAYCRLVALPGNPYSDDVRRVPPVYPEGAAAKGISGRVLMGYVVEPDGRVSTVNVLSSVPEGEFDSAAIAAIRQWRYCPAESRRTKKISVPFRVKK